MFSLDDSYQDVWFVVNNNFFTKDNYSDSFYFDYDISSFEIAWKVV